MDVDNEEELEDLLILYWFYQNKVKKGKRRWWVHTINQRRTLFGEFHRLVKELELDSERFHQYFRMSREEFKQILYLVEPYIAKTDTQMRESISPRQRLAICIRFLATGSSYKSLAFSYRVGASTICKIIPQVCKAIWERLVEIYMPMPKDQDDWRLIAKNFEVIWNFPHCIGAIDGKHVVVKAPANTGSLHYNYKGTFSVVLMALVGPNYKFINIDVGGYGRNSDGGIFIHSALGKALKARTLSIPADEPIQGADGLGPMPYVVVGDEAFPLAPYLMRPYPGGKKVLAEEEQIFNYRLSRARRISENAFGLLAARWRVYHSIMEVSPEVVNSIIKATCMLHNFLQTTSTPMQVTSLVSELCENGVPPGFQGLGRFGNRGSTEAIDIRERFKRHFAGVGEVSWQYNIVRKGIFNE